MLGLGCFVCAPRALVLVGVVAGICSCFCALPVDTKACVSQCAVQHNTVTFRPHSAQGKGGEWHIAIGLLAAMAEGTVRQDIVVYDDIISARVTRGVGQLL